jgi:hypothetical protein
MYSDLSEAIADVRQRGYTHVFDYAEGGLGASELAQSYPLEKLRIVDSIALDTGTDPGDDATLYLIESEDGVKGYLAMPAGQFADPAKAALIDRLLSQAG